MKKNFVRVMLFGALTLATVTYVGCKDYDDDIDNLQTQIDANAAGLAELQAKVNAGNWVTDIKSITGGFEITFNNGNKYSIVNGKDGSVVEIGENGNWFIDGVDTGKPARGEKGETGATGPVGPVGPEGPVGPVGPRRFCWSCWSRRSCRSCWPRRSYRSCWSRRSCWSCRKISFYW